MNRIERIIEALQGKIADYREKYPEKSKNDRWVIPSVKKQIEFFTWLLEEANEPPLYELHDKQVKPIVWGMGDVSYHVDIQLNKMDTGASPKILVFDFQSSERSETE